MSLTNEEIKTIALASGFELKENGDLRPYVYKFARLLFEVDSFSPAKAGLVKMDKLPVFGEGGGIVGSGTMLAPKTFQYRVLPWMMECFGAEISADRVERNHRFLEEALELVQSYDCTQDEAHQLVDYVFGRPVGEANQEVGGVMVTLAALCLAHNLDMHEAGESELTRIWTMVEKIRAKQAAKPKHSPLPV